MKTVLNPTYNPSFSPGASGVGTLTFSSYNTAFGFSINRLVAVINLTQGVIIYADSLTGFTLNSWNSTTNVLTLNSSTTGHSSTDLLEVIYDDPQASVSIAPPSITGGTQGIHHNLLTASTNITQVKGSAGVLLTCNLNAAYTGVIANNYFLKIFDRSTPPTLGTHTPILTLGAYMAQFNYTLPLPTCGVKFQNGLYYAVTANVSDTDTTAISIASATPIVDITYV